MFTLLLLTLSLSSPAWANVPSQFTVQGVLRDGSGTLQSTAVTFVVRIWQSQTSMDPSDLLFTYAPNPPGNTVMSSNGLFTIGVTLAPTDVTKISSALGSASVTSLWLEVTANGYTYARQPLTEVMSAIFADRLSTSCSGCVADSMISSVNGSKITGTVDVSQLAQPAGGKTSGSGFQAVKLTSTSQTIASLDIKAPGPGVVLATANGMYRVWVHTAGTIEQSVCTLSATGLTGYAGFTETTPGEMSAWGGSGVELDHGISTSQLFTVPVAGTYTVKLSCNTNSGCAVGLGCDAGAQIQAVYLPKAY